MLQPISNLFFNCIQYSDFKVWWDEIINISVEKHHSNKDSDAMRPWHMPNQKFD